MKLFFKSMESFKSVAKEKNRILSKRIRITKFAVKIE